MALALASGCLFCSSTNNNFSNAIYTLLLTQLHLLCGSFVVSFYKEWKLTMGISRFTSVWGSSSQWMNLRMYILFQILTGQIWEIALTQPSMSWTVFSSNAVIDLNDNTSATARSIMTSVLYHAMNRLKRALIIPLIPLPPGDTSLKLSFPRCSTSAQFLVRQEFSLH